jgi:hypothetical protein
MVPPDASGAVVPVVHVGAWSRMSQGFSPRGSWYTAFLMNISFLVFQAFYEFVHIFPLYKCYCGSDIVCAIKQVICAFLEAPR